MPNEIPPPPPLKPLPMRVITNDVRAEVDASGPQAPTPVQALARVLRGALLGVKYGVAYGVVAVGVAGVVVQFAKLKYPHLAAPLDTLEQLLSEIAAGLR